MPLGRFQISPRSTYSLGVENVHSYTRFGVFKRVSEPCEGGTRFIKADPLKGP